MADLTGQLKLQQQINQVLQERQALIQKNSQSLTAQARIAKELCAAMECKNLDQLEQRLDSIKQATEEAGQAAEENFETMEESAEKAAGALEKVEENALAIGAVTGAIKGLGQGLKNVGAFMKGTFRLFKGLTRAAFGLAKSIIAIPFQIFSGLVALSQQGGGGANAWRVALEELRAEMGDIATGPAKSLVDATLEMKKSFSATTGGVRSFRRVFGHGREGMAQALKFNTELAKGMGGTFHELGPVFKDIAGDLAVYRKGLGISGEQMGKIIKTSRALGKDYMETFKQFGKLSISMAKKYNMSSKNISRSMGELAANFEHFGSHTPEQIAATVVQMKRLGLEAKDIQGIIDKFDNYSAALDTAAKLRRNFGMQINASKMLSMTGIERTEHLRKAFAKTGQDFSKMSDLEQKMMAKTIGQSREATAAMFGEGNKQKDLNKVKTDAESIAKRTIKTQKILMKLSKNIEKQFAGGGGAGYKGFFDALAKGFQKGVMRTSEMRRAMRNLRKSLRVVDRAGRRIGRSFVKFFPGVKQFLDAFGDFFDPRFVHKNMLRVSNAFEKFFKALGNPKDTRKALLTLKDDIVGIFRDMFSRNKGAGKEMMGGLDTIISIFGNIKLIMLEKSIESASAFIEGFTTFLERWVDGKGSGQVGGMAGKIGDGFSERFGESFSNLTKVIEEKLLPALKKAGPVLFKAAQKLVGMFTNFLYENRDAVFEGVKKMLLFVFSMKFEFLKFAMQDPVLMMVLGFQMFSPLLFGAIGGIFKMGMAKVAASAAVRFAPEFAAKMVGGKVFKKSMPNLHRSMKNAISPAVGPKNKGLWKGMTEGFKKGSQKFAKIGAKQGIKAIGKGIATGVKAIPVAGWVAGLVIDAGFAMVDAVDRFNQTGKLSEAGKAFTGSFLSGLTLGMVSGDAIEDFIFGSTRQAEKAAKKQAEYAKQHAASFMEDYGDMFDGAKEKMNSLIAEFKGAGEAGAVALAKGGENLSDNEKEMLRGMISNQVSLSKIQEQGARAVDQMRADFRSHNSNLDAVYQAVKEELDRDHRMHDVYDDHVKVAEDMLDASTIAMLRHNGLIEDQADGFITINGDYKEFAMRTLKDQKHSERYMESMIKAQTKDTNFLYQTALMAGDKEKMAKTIQLLEKSGTDASAQRAQLDLALRSLEQKALLEEFGEYVDGKDIAAQYDRLFSETSLAGMTDEMRVKLQIRAGELERSVADQTQDLLESQQDRDQQKLVKMEAAAETMRRLKEVEGIPAEVERLQKKLAGLDEKVLDEQVKNLMEAVGNIADSVVKYTSDYGLDQVKTTISDSVVTALDNIKLMTGTVDSVMKSATSLGSNENIKTKMGRIAYALGQLKTEVAPKIKDLPTELIDTAAISQLQNVIMPSIVDPERGILTSIPSNIKTKISQANKTIDQIGSMMTRLKSQNTLKIAAKLAEGLSDDGKVEFEADNVTINIHFKVDMNARSMGQELLKVKTLNGITGNRLMTSTEINAR